MKSLARFHNLPLNLYDVIGDVTDQLKKSGITFFLKQCSRLPKYSIPSFTSQFNVKIKLKQENLNLDMPFKMLLPWQHQSP